MTGSGSGSGVAGVGVLRFRAAGGFVVVLLSEEGEEGEEGSRSEAARRLRVGFGLWDEGRGPGEGDGEFFLGGMLGVVWRTATCASAR